MAQVLVRGLEQEVVDRLKARAKASGSSLEEFARKTLREAASFDTEALLADLDRVRALSRPGDFDSTAYIREMRERGWHGD